jgi:hypothetical protein
LIGNIVEDLGSLILSPFKNNTKLKLVVVMIVYPIFFITLQFILTDSFIKKNIEVEDHKDDNRFECEREELIKI